MAKKTSHRVQAIKLIYMLWRKASKEPQKTTQLITRGGQTETNQEKNKRREKKYKNGEKHEWTPEIKNISFTDSNSGLHHTTISNTVNVSVLFGNEKQKIKHVRFDEQLLKSAGFFSTFCRWISVKLQREEAEVVDLWIKPHQILSNAGRQSRREAGGTLQHWSGAQ